MEVAPPGLDGCLSAFPDFLTEVVEAELACDLQDTEESLTLPSVEALPELLAQALVVVQRPKVLRHIFSDSLQFVFLKFASQTLLAWHRPPQVLRVVTGEVRPLPQIDGRERPRTQTIVLEVLEFHVFDIQAKLRTDVADDLGQRRRRGLAGIAEILLCDAEVLVDVLHALVPGCFGSIFFDHLYSSMSLRLRCCGSTLILW